MFANSHVRKISLAAAALLCTGCALGQNWLTDGGDNQRTGWNREEKILTPGNVGGLKLLWKVKTDVSQHALHSLMTPLVVQGVPTASGPKEMVYVLGVSDVLYGIDTATQQIAWEKHFTYEALPPARRPDGAAARPPEPPDPKHYNFLNPGGSTDVPVIGPADANGHRPIYVVDGGGNLHTLDDVTGEDQKPPIKMGVLSKFALQLYDGKVLFGSGNGINSADIKTGAVQKSVGFGGGGGLWGRRGPTITSDGTVWTTTGDGAYDPSKIESLILGNSVVGFHLDGDHWMVKDWFTPINWDWLRKRDLDPNNTPTVFNWHGRELMAASGKECRVYLLDPKNAGGGVDHHEPLYKTPLTCNEAVDFQNAGSWGALSTWEDAKGNRWIIQPFWGRQHSQAKFPITNTPRTVEGGEAAFKVVDKDGKPTLEPVWISRDMHRGEPAIIANGMIFAYGAGENSQQAWPDIGLNFDSSIRAAKSTHATIFVLDGQTGKELWSSGDQITTFSHFSSLTVANGKLYLGTFDGNLYCFGLPGIMTTARK